MAVYRSKETITSLKAKVLASLKAKALVKSPKKASAPSAVHFLVKHHAPIKRRKQLRRGSKTAFMLFHDCALVSQELQGQMEVGKE